MLTSLSRLGIGLSVVFGFLLLAFVAELYYLLWWKKRFNSRVEVEDEVDYSTNYGKELCHLSCWKTPSSLQPNPTQESGREADNGQEIADLEMGATRSRDLLIKAFGTEESVEAELMRLHNLAGPPRFLFTINEETREDMESEDGKSRNSDSRSRKSNLSDVMLAAVSPLASPRLNHQYYGFNQIFESSELNRLRSSPPPRFKFLRDAEDKLLKRLLMEEAERKALSKIVIQDSGLDTGETLEGSFLGFLVGKNSPRQQNSTSPAQVLPLDSSPATTNTLLRPELLDKSQHIVH